MKLLSSLRSKLAAVISPPLGIDRAKIKIFGIEARVTRKTRLAVPHEISVFIPRLEITNKVTEGGKTTETSLVLNSLTIVSAPRHEPETRLKEKKDGIIRQCDKSRVII